jgi:hypothetical protein
MQKFILEYRWRNIKGGITETEEQSEIFYIEKDTEDEARIAADRKVSHLRVALETSGLIEGLTGTLYKEIPLTAEEPAPIIRCIP